MTGLETRRPFTRANALAAGVSPKQLRGSRFRRIFRGVYIDSRVKDHPLIRAESSLLIHPPTAYASHFTAARVYGVPVPPHPFEHITVQSEGDRRQRSGLKCHIAAAGARVTSVSGLRISAPSTMFVELASVLGLVDLVVVGDALVRLRLVTVDELAEFCVRSLCRHGAAARRAVGYVRARVDSAMESRLRMLIVLSGLPEPEVNHEVRDKHGNVLMRFDLSFPGCRLIVEYDGRQHAERAKQWLHDVKRRELLDHARWQILIVTSEGIYQKPTETIERVHRALKERGARGLPAHLSAGWRPFFPER